MRYWWSFCVGDVVSLEFMLEKDVKMLGAWLRTG